MENKQGTAQKRKRNPPRNLPKKQHTRKDAIVAAKVAAAKKKKTNDQMVQQNDEPLVRNELEELFGVESDAEEVKEKDKSSLDHALLTQLLNQVSQLSARVEAGQRTKPPPATTLVVPGNYNWKTTDRNVKQAQALLQVVSGKFLFSSV